MECSSSFGKRAAGGRRWNAAPTMLAVALLCFGGVCAAEEVLPLYCENALSASEEARLRREIPSAVAAAERRLDETAKRRAALFKGYEETMQAVRVGKRLELARALCAFIRRAGVAEKERALYDLAAFERYFADEEKMWKVTPRPSSGGQGLTALPLSTSIPGPQPHRFDLVRDFGAVGDGKTPVNAAWRKAQEAIRALKGQPSLMTIPPGDYLFAEREVVPAFTCCYSGEFCRDENVRHAQAPVFALENCVIGGERPGEVKFVFGVFDSQGLRLVNCRNVTVRNIEVAYAKCPFLQGRITRVSPKEATCEVAVDAGTLTPDDPTFTEKGRSDGMLCCSAFSSAGDLDRNAAFMFYARKFTHLGGRNYRLAFDNTQKYYQHGNLKVGETLVLPARNNFYHAASMAYCSFCNFEGVWVRNSRAAAFSVHRGHQSTFDRCRVFPAEGRVLSANADGLINSCGTALLRSEIRNQSDDGFNSMSRGEFVCGAAGRDALLHGRVGRGEKGEMFLVVDPVSGRYRGNLFAREKGAPAPWRKGGAWKTTFTRPVPGDVATYDSLGLGLISRERQGRAAMNLERLAKEPDHIYAPSSDGIGSLVCACTIRNMRGSGLVIQSANALVENNTFSNIWRAVNLGGLVKYKEGPPPYNAIVRGNRVFDVESGFTTGYQVQDGLWAKCAPIRGVLFASNSVERATFEAYGLRNLGFSRLVGNRARRARKVARFFCTEDLTGEDNDFALPRETSREMRDAKRDLMSDTWVATDGEGRSLPTVAEVGLPRPDRTVALFYFLTHGPTPQAAGPFDMAKILAADPEALAHDSPLLGGLYAPHYWAEPLFGYYCGNDPFVIRKHAQMLGDAGVDVIVFDVTNGPTFDDQWEAILAGFTAVREHGGKTPQVAFLCPFQPQPPPGIRGQEVRHLWEKLYKNGRYSDLWFRWNGKPLILAHPSYCAPEAVAFGNAENAATRYPARLEKGHTLGQRFTSAKPFGSVSIDTPTYGTHPGCAATLILIAETPAGRILAKRRFTEIADNENLELVLDEPASAGTYRIELSEVEGSVGWWSSRPIPGNATAGALADGRSVEGFRSFTCRAAENGEDAKMRSFFTFRRPVPGYHEKSPLRDGWSWLEVWPQHVYSDEMMAVGVAQNAKKDRKCAMSEPGAMGRRWHNGANDPDPKALALGPNFQEQWDCALAADPRLVFVTGWNEWWASRFPAWGGFSQPGGVYPDIFNPEFSRDCEPTKILFGDAYYWQLVANIRRYKGVRPVPPIRSAPIHIDGDFSDWERVSPEFRDTAGDEVKRDFAGVAQAGRYVDASGRNDIVAAKVSRNGDRVFFYVETREPLTAPAEGIDWMRLLIDIDRSAKTGYLGYDFLVERDKTGFIVRRHQPPAKKRGCSWGWAHPCARAEGAVKGNAIELAIPIAAFGKDFRPEGFFFKWEDHALQSYDWTDFTLHGDAAPNDRYAYHALFAPSSANPYGTTSHLTRTGYWDRTKLCAKYGGAGAKWMRMDFDWRVLEPAPGRWDFTRYDDILATAESNGVQIVGILTSPPPRAAPVWKNLDQWRTFVRTTCSRYRGRIPVYEIWNEQDAETFWGYKPDATNYVALLRASYETIKSVDPAIRVAIGSITAGGLPFCAASYAAGAKDCFDIMNVHPYSVYGRPGNSDPEGFVDVWLAKLRAIMSRFGDADKEVWITEIGWPSPPELGFRAPGVLKSGLRAIDPKRTQWTTLVIDNVFARPAGGRTLLEMIARETPPGSKVEGCACADAARAIRAVRPDLVVVTPHIQQFPIEHDRALLDFARGGGVIAVFGGMPFYEGMKGEKKGTMHPGELRRALRLAPQCWWMRDLPAVPKEIKVFPTAAASAVKPRKGGYACPRFISDRYLQKGDVMTPLLTATWTNGVTCIGAAAIRFAGGGGVVFNGMFEAPFGTFSERDQAAYVARCHLLAFNAGVSTVMWYELRSHDFDRQDEGWGMLHLDLTEKLSWSAYKTLIARHPAGSLDIRRSPPKDGLWRADWVRPDGRLAGAVWTTEAPRTVALNLGPGDFSFCDFLGRPLTPPRENSRYLIPVSGEVVYFTQTPPKF